MKASEPAAPTTPSVPAALLDYFEAPGKYQLTLRQPAVLFASVREILQLASGRGSADAPQSPKLREAASFFLRAALLYPGADHYALLGLPPGEATSDLKERYRLLMRLIHPDYAAGAAIAWPDDAAVRVNRAYEVLSSPVLRREYDEQLASLRTRRPVAPEAPVRPRAVAPRPAPRPATVRRPVGRKLAWVLGAAALIPAGILLMSGGEPEHLVQRPRARPAAPAPAPSVASLATPSAVPATPSQPAPSVQPDANLAAPAPVPAASPALPGPEIVQGAAAQPAASARAVPNEVALVRPMPAPPLRPPVPPTAGAMPVAAPAIARPAVLETPPTRPAEAVAAVAMTAPEPRPLPPMPASAAPLAPVATAAPASRMTVTLALPQVPAPTLEDAQPLLTQLLQVLETGNGDQVLRLLDSDARVQPGAQALSRQYEQMVRGGRPIRLSQVDFTAEPREGGTLLVTGRIRLHAGEPTIGSFGQKLVLRAEFAQRSGKVHLTGLGTAPD